MCKMWMFFGEHARTLGEGMGTPGLRPFQKVKNP